MSIRGRMIAMVAGPTLVIYLVVLGLTLRHLDRDNREAIEREMTRLAQNYAARFDAELRQAATVADATASFMETNPDPTERQIYEQLRRSIERAPYIYGAAMAFEPGSYLEDDSLYSPYVYRDGAALKEMNISEDVYDWYRDQQWQWFRQPKAEGRGIWTDPYFDEGAGNVLMVTYSAPFSRDGSFRGVTTVDLELPVLNESIGKHILGDQPFFVLTPDGTFVYSSTPEQDGGNVFDVIEQRNRPDIREVAAHVVRGETGVSRYPGIETVDPPGSMVWLFHAPIESAGWGFASKIYQREALADVRRRMFIAAGALGLTLLLIVGAIVFVSGRLTRPIVKLREGVAEISTGDLDARVTGIDTNDEIGDLARAFNQMTDDLRGVVDNLASEQAAREKIERDLDIARQIQQGLLPQTTPHLSGFDIAGWNRAADKTGGDYYDWLGLPDGRVVVTLADVTGHGIGPALLVAVCRAYMRASVAGQNMLGEALARVNDLLYEDVPTGRFITAVVGVVNPAVDSIELLSAGHGPILFFESATQSVHFWGADHPPLGVVGDSVFPQSRTLECRPGDTLVLTTDGFFEWANAAGELYGTERLEQFVRQHHHLDPGAMIEALHVSVLEFAGGTEQADDLTAVVIKKA